MLPLKEFIKHKLYKENIFKIPFMTEHFVCKFIYNLDNNKATGIDNISIKILKLSSPLIDKHITNIATIVYALEFSQMSGKKHALFHFTN